MEKGVATHSSILAWRIPMDGGAWWATVHGAAKSWTQLSDSAQHNTGSISPAKSSEEVSVLLLTHKIGPFFSTWLRS